MIAKGVELRAREARATVAETRDAVHALDDVAQTVAILWNALEAAKEHLTAEQRASVLTGEDAFDRFARMLDYYRDYHRVGR